MLIPAHNHPTRMARRRTRAIARGRKSFTSPTTFMARETHNSPPVPATTMREKRIASSNLALLQAWGWAHRVGLRAARAGLPNDEHAQADDGYAQPAQRRNRLTQHEISQQCHYPIPHGGRGEHE